MKLILILLLFFLTQVAYPQGHFRLYVENDVFAWKEKGDRYYTNGIKLEWINPKYHIRFLDKIFPDVKELTSETYGWALGQNIYTSSDITVSDIIPGDRPYAGWLYINLKKFSNSTTARRRISSDLSLGVIGPAALACPVQKGFHQLINSDRPEGWSHQIKNNPGINYSIELEQELYDSDNKHMDMIWFTNVEVGTVFDNFGMGTLVRLAPFRVLDSYFESTFSKHTTIRKMREGVEGKHQKENDSIGYLMSEQIPMKEKKKAGIYFFVKPSVRFVAYNALLQGGIFNGSGNDYTISPNELERMYLNFDMGVVIPLGYRWDVVYGQTFRTTEFRGAPVHYWGFINIIYNSKTSRQSR
ncbi:lipid A deacylase LpxR family protein [Chryseolinea sp. H1M3-3]|uniref:lipid A deacylase LpxR family protein n=1 Tax=Chryseolinea sp. H1M3-3 TaxID=3034144 RepID=UPI0023ED714C|nr:lipid A deacylase LpxR family protein [Chryseolinea sp. H1M3-3]